MSDIEIENRRKIIIMTANWFYGLDCYERFLLQNGYSQEYEKTTKLQRRKDLVELIENLDYCND